MLNNNAIIFYSLFEIMNFVNTTHSVNARSTIQHISNKLPDPPTSLAYISGSATINSVNVTFTAPTSIAIISYSPSSGAGSGILSPYTISGLTSNTSYPALTLTTNGPFKSSTPSSSISVLTLPDAPTIGTATVSGTTASVVFIAPSGNGTITNYTATSNVGGLTGTGTSSPISVTGLTSGTAYTFTVTATNASGTSTASSVSNSITPAASGNKVAISSVANWQPGDITGTSIGSTGTNYNVYSFNTINTSYIVNYTCNSSTVVNLFCIGGGGQGGQYCGGGGGAGGVIQTSVTLPVGSGTISIIVGAGSGSQGGTIQPALSGYNTTVTFNATGASYIAYGGGGGGTGRAINTAPKAGGSGGGAAIINTIGAGFYTNTVAGQSAAAISAGNIGYAGAGYYFPGKNQMIHNGGGGGAGAPAPSIVYNTVPKGGAGMLCTLDGISQFSPNGTTYGTYYWAGGGGGIMQVAGSGGGSGGIGGGGCGSLANSTRVVGGTGAINNSPVPPLTGGGGGGVNTGGGGGGFLQSGSGGSGGSGIVLIAFS